MGNELDWLDLAVIAGMLLASWTVGIFYTCRLRKRKFLSDPENNLDRYLVGNRKIGIIPSALSIAATTMSGSAILGVIAEVYLYGSQYAFFAFGSFVSQFFVAIAVVPVYRRLQCISIYEYLEKRFDRNLRLLFSVLYIIARIGISSVILYVPALCLMTLSSVPYWLSIVVSGCICTLYCTLGGIKAVIWTDVLQSAFMVSCNVAVIYFGIANVGGWTEAWDRAFAGGRIGTFTFIESANTRYSVWSLFFGGVVISMGTMISGQAGLQRVLCVRGVKQAQTATVLSGFLIMSFLMTSIATATVIYSNFARCDPLTSDNLTKLQNPDQIMLLAITGFLLLPGLKGLAIAGILSGALSSFSSLISAFAILTVEDLITPLLAAKRINMPGLTDRKKLLLCKITTICYGTLCMLLAFVVPQLGGINKTTIQIVGSVGGPLTAVILLGMLSRKANTKGVIVGLTMGLAFNVWVSLGSAMHEIDYKTLPITIEGCPSKTRRGRMLDVIPPTDWDPLNVTSTIDVFSNTMKTEEKSSELYTSGSVFESSIKSLDSKQYIGEPNVSQSSTVNTTEIPVMEPTMMIYDETSLFELYLNTSSMNISVNSFITEIEASEHSFKQNIHSKSTQQDFLVTDVTSHTSISGNKFPESISEKIEASKLTTSTPNENKHPAVGFTSAPLSSTDGETQSNIFPLYALSYMWYGPLGFIITVCFGLVFSEVIGSDSQKVDPRLLSPIICNKTELQLSCELNVGLLIGKRTSSNDSVGNSNDVDNLTNSDIDSRF